MKLLELKKSVFNKEVLVHIVLWILLFNTINVSWTSNWIYRIGLKESILASSVIFFLCFFYIHALWLVPRFFKTRTWHYYFLIVSLVVLIPELTRAVLVVLESSYANFYEAVYWETYSRDSFLLGVPSPFWSAFILSSAYRFTKDRILNTQKIERLENQQMAMQLSALKAQINPHFLFNNLNALDDLISRDQQLAREYLHKLSKILRYSIASTDNDIVNLKDEWKFIDDYIYLIEERFGGAYRFNKIKQLTNIEDYLIPPASLQTLVENVVKHNQGNIENPLITTMKIDESSVSISHEKRPKNGSVNQLGTGLNNLRSRYQLLSNKEIIIEDAEIFSVTLPLIKQIE